MRFYRLEDSVNELPKTWAYGDSLEVVPRSGFQVWSCLSRVVAVAAGESSADGEYGLAQGYTHFHVIDAADCYDGADEWFAVRCEDVQLVRCVELKTLLDWAIAAWKQDIEDGYDAYEENFEEWCNDCEDLIAEWLESNLQPVAPVFVDTLLAA